MQSIRTFLTLVSDEFCCSFGEIWPLSLTSTFPLLTWPFNFPSTCGIVEASSTVPDSSHLPLWSTPHSLPEWLLLKLSNTVYDSAWIYPSCCISITTLVKLWSSNALLSSPSTPLPLLSLHPAVPFSWNSLPSLHLTKDFQVGTPQMGLCFYSRASLSLQDSFPLWQRWFYSSRPNLISWWKNFNLPS